MTTKTIKVNHINNIIDESILPSYYNSDHYFSDANLKMLDRHLVNLLGEYSIKEIRSALNKINKKKKVA